MDEFFRLMEVNGSAIGNHEFDFEPSFSLPYTKENKSLSLAANLISEKEKNFCQIKNHKQFIISKTE